MIFKTLPSIISSINQLGEASNKLKAINFSMVGLNAGNLDAYRNAISGISKEQAALLLSTQGLNQAQIDLVLSNEKVTASEIAEAATLDGITKKKNILTVEQQKQLISSQALTTEKLAEISATLGLETAENGSLISKKALNAEMVKQQLESIRVVGSTQAQIMNMLRLTTAETSAATASNVLSGAMAKLSLAMSANPIGALITVIGIAIASVYGLTKAFDALTDSAEEIDERVDDLISKYNDLKSTADNNASTVETLADEYELLSKGVNDLGENVSLTSEEYARYNEIVNQIADMFPTMISGYTDEGTAILSLKGNVEQLRDAYKEAQQEAYNLLVATGKDSDGNDIMESYKNLSELDWWNSSLNTDDVTTVVKRDITKQILDLMSNMDTAVEEYDKLAQKIFDTYGSEGYNFLEEMGLSAIKDVFSDTSGITEEALIAGRATVQSYYQGFQSEIDTKLSKVKLVANAFLNTNDFYLDDSTSSELKNALSVIVNSIDEELANTFNGEHVKVGTYVNNIINGIKNNEEIQKELIDLFTIDTTDMSVSDIVEQINEYINSIAIAINENPEELKIRLGFDYVDDLEAQYQRAVDFAKDKFNGYDPTTFFKEYSINTQEEIDAWQKIAQGARDATESEKEYLNQDREPSVSKTFDKAWADSFTSENDAIKELGNNLLELAEKGRLTIETFIEADSTDYFKNLGISADEAVSKINKLVDESKQLSSMSSQISSMAEALGTKLENGFVDADTLAGFDVEIRGLDSWDRFQTVLGSTTSSYKECQEAANALAKEWVNSSDFLAQLTEQNKEYYETQLKAMGIENYEEIISYAQALDEAKDALAQSSLDLSTATEEEIQALIDEGTYSELAQQQIWTLYAAKLAEQASYIDSSADCQQFLNLANDANLTAEAIRLLTEMMSIYSGLESGVYSKSGRDREYAYERISQIKSELDALANGEGEGLIIEPTVKLGNKGKSSAKSAGKDAGKSLKDGLKEELSDLDSVISGITKSIDSQISLVKEEKDVALEAIEAQITALEEERDARLAVIEAQKEQLEQQIKAIDKQIDAKQKEIDKINEAADAKRRENELMLAQYNLEKMMNQRTKLVK